MNRRILLAMAAVLPVTFAAPAWAADFIDYKPGVIEKALGAGKTVFVDYYAPWCITCRSQSRTLTKLIDANPAYAKKMTFVRVDWDTYGAEPVARDRQIPRRSTLLVLRGDKELGRIVAGTSEADIKALLDKGL
jgi:thioredoxin 1